MPEVQKHGFIWERELATKVYGATEEELEAIGYTAVHDLPLALNKLDSVNVSCKTSCAPNTVCMGDALRLFDSVNSGEKLHATVVHYKQVGEEKHLTSIVQVDLTASKELLFGTLNREQIEELDKLIKKVPQKCSPSVEEHSAMYTLRNTLKCPAILLNIKCNSQQSRLQCSFNGFQKFLSDNPGRIISKSQGNIFRGQTIISVIKSARRIFNK
ncbi:MAG: hypothetical protein EBU66_16060 [Bacteroidetes bacterium]|nr:hypothetical protein [Bacteroidota bacterium]